MIHEAAYFLWFSDDATGGRCIYRNYFSLGRFGRSVGLRLILAITLNINRTDVLIKFRLIPRIRWIPTDLPGKISFRFCLVGFLAPPGAFRRIIG